MIGRSFTRFGKKIIITGKDTSGNYILSDGTKISSASANMIYNKPESGKLKEVRTKGRGHKKALRMSKESTSDAKRDTSTASSKSSSNGSFTKQTEAEKVESRRIRNKAYYDKANNLRVEASKKGKQSGGKSIRRLDGSESKIESKLKSREQTRSRSGDSIKRIPSKGRKSESEKKESRAISSRKYRSSEKGSASISKSKAVKASAYEEALLETISNMGGVKSPKAGLPAKEVISNYMKDNGIRKKSDISRKYEATKQLRNDSIKARSSSIQQDVVQRPKKTTKAEYVRGVEKKGIKAISGKPRVKAISGGGPRQLASINSRNPRVDHVPAFDVGIAGDYGAHKIYSKKDMKFGNSGSSRKRDVIRDTVINLKTLKHLHGSKYTIDISIDSMPYTRGNNTYDPMVYGTYHNNNDYPFIRPALKGFYSRALTQYFTNKAAGSLTSELGAANFLSDLAGETYQYNPKSEMDTRVSAYGLAAYNAVRTFILQNKVKKKMGTRGFDSSNNKTNGIRMIDSGKLLEAISVTVKSNSKIMFRHGGSS